MPRRREIARRDILPDPLYNSQLVTRFVNVVMRDGKKATAERILYEALEAIKQRTSDDPMKVFKRAIENVKPAVEVKSRRVGGSTYQVPVEVRPGRAHHAPEAGGGTVGRRGEPRRCDQEEGGHPPHGGRQQGVRALSVVSASTPVFMPGLLPENGKNTKS